MADRPVECSQCKKPLKVVYKEIVDDSILCTEMCEECPILQGKLYGETVKAPSKEGGLYCGQCGTSLEGVKMGQPLGCGECYAVFGDFLVGVLIAAKAVPPSLSQKLSTKRAQPIHIGKSP